MDAYKRLVTILVTTSELSDLDLRIIRELYLPRFPENPIIAQMHVVLDCLEKLVKEYRLLQDIVERVPHG